MTKTFDIAVIGAGVVGSAIAREFSRYQLRVALIEAAPDVGMGTSKGSTAIWHTGFDAKPGSLEATLMRRSYALMDQFMPEANIPHERIGAILIAWNPEQLEALPALQKKAFDNGVHDVTLLSPEEIYRREPHISAGALGGLFVPGEGILCTFTVPLALATQAVSNGVELFLNHPVKSVRREADDWILNDEIRSRYVVNAAGLYSDEINALFGQTGFTVTPRRGQLIVYDKLARPLVNHVLLPVPTSKTKGVLISPTVYGNILLGPTAEDLQDKTASETTEEGLQMLIGKGREILPSLLDEEVTATYSGLRAATEHGDYQVLLHADINYLCVGGIRSTGISAAMGIAEYAAELLTGAGLVLEAKTDFKPVKMPGIGEVDMRPHRSAEMIAENPEYGEIVCHCELVSRGEINDAMQAVIPATTIDGLRRRTRALQGRCQGFNCHAALVKSLELGKPSPPRKPSDHAHSTGRSLEKDVVIVGAGPAGLAAAIELKKRGVQNILLVDREPEAGGTPRMCYHTGFGRKDLWRMFTGPRYAKHYRELAEQAGVEIQTSTTITGWGETPHTLTFTSPDGLGEIQAKAVLLATGVREQPRAARLVPGTRPQGIFTTGSLQRFIFQERLPVGRRAVIVGAELVSLSALMTLWEAGVKCLAMTTDQPRHRVRFPYILMKWAVADLLTRTPIHTSTRITNIQGKQRVEAVELTGKDGQTTRLDCDMVVFTGNWIPENEMARRAGLQLNPLTNGPEIDAGFQSSSKGIFVAGNLLRGLSREAETADECAVEGKRAAKSIADYLRNVRA